MTGGRPSGDAAAPTSILAVALTTLTLLAVLAPPGSAQSVDPGTSAQGPMTAETGPPVSSVNLSVTELSGVLGPGAPRLPTLPSQRTPQASDELTLRVLVENDGAVALDSLRVVTEIHPAVRTRAMLREALDGDLGSQPLHVHVTDELGSGPLEPEAVLGVADSFTRDDVRWAEGSGGVHPVRIAVTRGTEVLDEVVTSVVWLNTEPESPLLTTLVWPLDAMPWRSAGGAYPHGGAREIRPGGRLDALLLAAEDAPGTPLVLAPAAHLLEDLGDRADGFDAIVRQEDGSLETRRIEADDEESALSRQTLRRIRELTADQVHPPLTGTYADADLDAIAAASGPLLGMGGDAAVEGRRRVQLQLGRSVDASVHLVDGPISPPVLDLLPGDAILLPSAATGLSERTGGPSVEDAVRTIRTPAGRLLTVLVADPYLEEAFAATGHPAGPVVTAQRIIAESAMAYLVAPGLADRGLVLLPPTTWDPSPRTASQVVEGLAGAPWIELESPSRIASDARRSADPLVLATPEDGAFRAELVDGLARANAGLASLRAALPEPDSHVQGRSLQELQDDLLRATSRWYRSPVPGEADALVRDVQRAIDTTLGEVAVTTGTVTLTSDTGEIPVTLQRTRGGPLNVLVEVESQGRLLWPDGRRSEPLLLPEGGSQTVSFPTRALSTGSFPVTVRVTDPTGSTTIANTTLSVRSTAISGVALTGTGLLVVVLLLFGAFRRRERARPNFEVVRAR